MMSEDEKKQEAPRNGGGKDNGNGKDNGLLNGEVSRAAEEKLPPVLPVLPLGDVVVFPGMVAPLVINTQRSAKLIDEVAAGNRFFLSALQKNRQAADDQVHVSDLHEHGCVTRLLKMLRFPDETVRVLVQGVSRCKLGTEMPGSPFLKADYVQTPDELEESVQLAALARQASQVFQEIITMSPTLPDELKIAVVNIEDPSRLSDLVAANLNLNLEERQALLMESRTRLRLKRLMPLLNREREVLRVGAQIQNKVSETFTKNQREFFLREQLKAIRKELGEQDPSQVEAGEIDEKIAKSGMPDEVKKVALKERDRLAQIPSMSPEHGVIRTYLDLLCEMPWAVSTEDNLEISNARDVLDHDHFGLKKVKDRILEFLAVLKLKKDMKGPILCLVGPPGVGKTSLGQSVARALGRKFIRMSLGGMRDEAEIRGHRRTYIGAMPGRIIQNIRKAGSRNPVFMLDEIDKVGADFRGDPSAALLEVLDPSQNHTFTDHYLDVPFDLSQVLFIATANIVDTMPEPLRDRMELIELPGYTQHEKLKIAQQYLVPKQIDAHGLRRRQVRIGSPVLSHIIADYTREAGVRNLDREIANVCRKIAREVAEGKNGTRTIGPADLHDFLGPVKFEAEVAEKKVEPGVVTGLAWTPTGGDILFIEATKMPGKGNLILTGSLGDVMKESARAALSYARAHAREWKIDDGELGEKNDLHIHVPAGAIPKDGPSAGVAMLASIYSLMTGRPISPDIAMTGEITLRGRVMPIGGVKEKVLAAARAGIKKVLLPAKNKKNLEDVPEEIRKKMKFIFVERAEEALRALTGK